MGSLACGGEEDPEYDPSLTCGVYQINEEIDVSHEDEEEVPFGTTLRFIRRCRR